MVWCYPEREGGWRCGAENKRMQFRSLKSIGIAFKKKKKTQIKKRKINGCTNTDSTPTVCYIVKLFSCYWVAYFPPSNKFLRVPTQLTTNTFSWKSRRRMKAIGKTRKVESKHPYIQTRALPSRSIVLAEPGKNIWHKQPTATALLRH